jgi:hypothetical protein
MLVVLQITTNMTTLDMPIHFAVKIDWRGREGYSLLEARKENDIFILRNIYHGGVFYNIEDCDRPADPRTDFTCKTKKISGTVEHKITWRHSTQRLRHQNTLYPIIAFTAKTRTFIPITVRDTATQPQAPLTPQQAEPVVKFPIKTIPQHAVNLLLLGSFLNEEECSITGSPINSQNGAVTTCFHVFEKEAITRWIDLPSSNKKCPVCMQPCDVYSLNLDQ